jgi:hypothetical protein
MLIENTYRNEQTDIKKHCAYIKNRFRNSGIGIFFTFLYFFTFFIIESDRFKVLHCVLCLEIDDLKKLYLQLHLKKSSHY